MPYETAADDLSRVEQVRSRLIDESTSWLTTDDLLSSEISRVRWSGSRSHVQGVRATRARDGEVDYLAVRADGQPVAIGGVNYDDPKHHGELWQLSTHPDLQGLGIGSVLIAALEERISNRGLPYAWIGVDQENSRARQLYGRRGYETIDEGTDSWDEADPDGVVATVRIAIWWMRRPLT